MNDSVRAGLSPAPEVFGGQWALADVVARLRVARMSWRKRQGRGREPGGRELPSREALAEIVHAVCGALFPMRLGPPDLREESEDFYVGHTLDSALNALLAQVKLELNYQARHEARERPDLHQRAVHIVQDFAAALPGLRGLLDDDVMAAFRRPGRAQRGRSAAVLPRHPGRAASPPGPSAISDWRAAAGADDCRAGACANRHRHPPWRADWPWILY